MTLLSSCVTTTTLSPNYFSVFGCFGMEPGQHPRRPHNFLSSHPTYSLLQSTVPSLPTQTLADGATFLALMHISSVPLFLLLRSRSRKTGRTGLLRRPEWARGRKTEHGISLYFFLQIEVRPSAVSFAVLRPNERHPRLGNS